MTKMPDRATAIYWGAEYGFGLGLNGQSPLVDWLARNWVDKRMGIYLEPYRLPSVVDPTNTSLWQGPGPEYKGCGEVSLG